MLCKMPWVMFLCVLLLLLELPSASCETLYVVTQGDDLNGRSEPSIHAPVEMRIPNGEAVQSVSSQNGWVEIVGGETGTVWCREEYLSSAPEASKFRNVSGGRVFVRDTVKGHKTGLEVPANKTVTVRIQRDGWGKVSSGWVDLSFFEEVCK